MENIMQAITEAEEKAAAIKAEAMQRAAEIVADAESKATETEKNAVAVCKAYKATQTKAAMENANAEYTAEIAKNSAEAKANAEKKMQDVDAAALRIVGRITRVDC